MRLAAADPVVLGHEFAGIVEAVGPAVRHTRPGDRAAVLPVLGCGACAWCRRGPDDEINCPQRRMLGVDRDGAFAEHVVVPGRCVYPVPDSVPFAAAAYAEPVAAALAVLDAGLHRGQRGLILGRNRFSVLVERLLALHGITEVMIGDRDVEPEADGFDFVIETGLAADTLMWMLRAVRPGGTLVLKSRHPLPVELDVRTALLKQVTIRAVNYGSFRRAVALLVEGRLDLEGLIGDVLPLERFADAFARARSSESAKLFLDPTGEHVRHRR